MAQEAKIFDPERQSESRPIVVVEMQADADRSTGEASGVIGRARDILRQAAQTAVTSPAVTVQESAGQALETTGFLGRKAAKAAVKSYLARREKVSKSPINQALEARVQKVVRGTKNTITQVRDAVDPRVVAGGLVGLTAGEIVGGAVGGVAGASVAGPAGAVVGAQVGSFTAGMLGLKLGADAVYDRLEENRARKATGMPSSTAELSRKTSVGRFLQVKSGERLGEIVGLTSGASIGLVVAGPAGGLVGAVIGEALGGHLGEDLGKAKPNNKGRQNSDESVNQWLDRFGKNTAGEAASVLVAGSVGSIFGPGGRLVGHRIGLIVGKRVEWHKTGLGEDRQSEPGAAQTEAFLPTQAPFIVKQPGSGALERSSDAVPNAGQPDATDSSGLTDSQIMSLPKDPAVYFTERQIEVLRLMSKQRDTKEIAEELGIAPSTVNYHKRNIYKKIEATSNPQSAYDALELGPDAVEH